MFSYYSRSQPNNYDVSYLSSGHEHVTGIPIGQCRQLETLEIWTEIIQKFECLPGLQRA